MNTHSHTSRGHTFSLHMLLYYSSLLHTCTNLLVCVSVDVFMCVCGEKAVGGVLQRNRWERPHTLRLCMVWCARSSHMGSCTYAPAQNKNKHIFCFHFWCLQITELILRNDEQSWARSFWMFSLHLDQLSWKRSACCVKRTDAFPKCSFTPLTGLSTCLFTGLIRRLAAILLWT